MWWVDLELFVKEGMLWVLTSIGRPGDEGKREAGLASIENMEEMGKVGISLSLFFNML